jgi:TolB-like protein
MDSDRFHRVEELYHAALERPPDQRSAFLDQACGNDAQLRSEVESLLAFESKADQFLEKPAAEVASDTGSSLLGRRLSRYHIVEKLGSGGMGVVYQAHDEILGRDVALKVLPPGSLQDAKSRKRFRKEAEALSKVRHPNVAVIYDFDSQDALDFIVMELIPGITLDQKIVDGPLPEEEVLQLGLQLTEGLSAAHNCGVIHRDLKPHNLRLDHDGRLKILDFGLAKSSASEGNTETLTEPDAIQGTLPYMAPEQLLGEKADASTDVYACGAVLYEMATGRRLFDGRKKRRLVHAIVHDTPTPPRTLNGRISTALNLIILKCLAKEPENRYPTAAALGDDLRRLAAGAPSLSIPPRRRIAAWGATLLIGTFVVALAAYNLDSIRGRFTQPAGISSLAVLPLENLSRDPEQEYFADGVTDALITDLAKIGALRVVSRTSVMRYKRTQKSLSEIARELDVDAIVEGAINRVGDRVRITAQLVRAANDRHLWAETYERDMQDVLLLQDEVARSIAEQIQVKVTPAEHERLTHARKIDPEVYELYLKGRYFWGMRTEASIQKAIDIFQQAITKDPMYGAAYSGLADCYSSLGFSFDVGSISPREIQPKALAAARKAADLDDSSAEAHSSLAFIKLNYDWDWTQSEQEFRKGIELNPGWANGHHWYAHHLLSSGRTREAETESLRALELDPLSAIMNAHLGWHFYFVHDYGKSLEALRKTLDLVPNYGLAFWYTGWDYEQMGMYAEALHNLERAKELLAGNVNVDADIGHVYAVSGNKAGAERVIANLKKLSTEKYVNPFEIALIYVGLGDKDNAFEWLDKAYQQRSDMLVYLNVDPRLDVIRHEPRFIGLVKKVAPP